MVYAFMCQKPRLENSGKQTESLTFYLGFGLLYVIAEDFSSMALLLGEWRMQACMWAYCGQLYDILCS